MLIFDEYDYLVFRIKEIYYNLGKEELKKEDFISECATELIKTLTDRISIVSNFEEKISRKIYENANVIENYANNEYSVWVFTLKEVAEDFIKHIIKKENLKFKDDDKNG
jgi:hypothetical protein